MSKTKSVVMTVIISIVIVILSLICVVPDGLHYGTNGVDNRQTVVSVINYGSDLGGGYSATYYPEGVISAEEYNAQTEWYISEKESVAEKAGLDADGEEAKELVEWKILDHDEADYIAKYVAYTASGLSAATGKEETALFYMEDGVACETAEGGGYAVKDSFKEDFDKAVEVIAKRFDQKNLSFLNVSKVNGYTIRVDVPESVDDYETLFTQMGYMGEFTLRASEEIRNGALLGAGSRPISDYFKSASSGSSGTTGYVILNMTAEGRKKVASITEELKDNETDATLYFYVGDQQLIGLGLEETIDQKTLYISGSFTPETANNVGIVINSCIKGDNIALALNVSAVTEYTIGGSSNVMTAVFIVFAAAIALMAVYSIVRYRGLGVTHIFGYLSYLICMLMFIAFLDGMILTASGIAALAITSVLTVLSNYYVFENVRKEFNVGKTLDTAIKDGYKRSLAGLLDTHILLFILGLVLYFVSVGELVPFAYIFTLGVLMSGIVSLLLTRFYWFSMRGLVRRGVQYKFCGFKREVIDDDED